MEKSQVLGAFVATRFCDRTTWLPSSNHLQDETRGGVESKHLKGIFNLLNFINLCLVKI